MEALFEDTLGDPHSRPFIETSSNPQLLLRHFGHKILLIAKKGETAQHDTAAKYSRRKIWSSYKHFLYVCNPLLLLLLLNELCTLHG